METCEETVNMIALVIHQLLIPAIMEIIEPQEDTKRSNPNQTVIKNSTDPASASVTR